MIPTALAIVDELQRQDQAAEQCDNSQESQQSVSMPGCPLNYVKSL